MTDDMIFYDFGVRFVLVSRTYYRRLLDSTQRQFGYSSICSRYLLSHDRTMNTCTCDCVSVYMVILRLSLVKYYNTEPSRLIIQTASTWVRIHHSTPSTCYPSSVCAETGTLSPSKLLSLSSPTGALITTSGELGREFLGQRSDASRKPRKWGLSLGDLHDRGRVTIGHICDVGDGKKAVGVEVLKERKNRFID